RKPFGLARRVRAPLAERRGRLPLEDGLAPDRRRPAAQALGGHAAPRSAHQDARGLRRGRQPRPAPGGRWPGAAHVDPRGGARRLRRCHHRAARATLGRAPGPRGGRGDLRGIRVGGGRAPRRAVAAMIPFAKGHGLGNDYIVIEEKDLRAPLSEKAIERICDRNWGVGSDGILLLVPSQRADFGLRIFNPDGSEAEKSGNGLRIFAKYLWDHGRTKKTTFTVDTKGGVVECQCRVE